MLHTMKRISGSYAFRMLTMMWSSFWISFALGAMFSKEIAFIILGLGLYSFYIILELLAIHHIKEKEDELNCLIEKARKCWLVRSR